MRGDRGRGRRRGGGGFGGEVGFREGVADAAIYEGALLLGRAGDGFALGVELVVGEGRWRRGFENCAEDGGVGEDAPIVDEAQAGAGGLRGGVG